MISSEEATRDAQVVELENTESTFAISTELKLFAIWQLWLICGTCFYYHYDKFTLAQSFYMSVSVGYSIGWGYPLDPNDWSCLFSTFYILV